MKENTVNSKTRRIVGWVLTILAILFLLFDGIGKIIQPAPVVEATQQLGFASNQIGTIGIILLICTIIYAIPSFSVLGAVLLTGFLGGAIAIQFKAGNPLFSHTLFPLYIAAFVWGGLVLRTDILKRVFSLNRVS